MPYKNPYPPIRISPKAKAHLDAIVNAIRAKGRMVSLSSFMTDLILSQPIPNGHGPAAEQEQVKEE